MLLQLSVILITKDSSAKPIKEETISWNCDRSSTTERFTFDSISHMTCPSAYAIAIRFRDVTDPPPLNFSLSIRNRKFFSDLVCRSVVGKTYLSPILLIFKFNSFRGNKIENISWNFHFLFVDLNYKSFLYPK